MARERRSNPSLFFLPCHFTTLKRESIHPVINLA
nr:MAG TPA: hypothetical protein [Caudoviricetes sp.]